MKYSAILVKGSDELITFPSIALQNAVKATIERVYPVIVLKTCNYVSDTYYKKISLALASIGRKS